MAKNRLGISILAAAATLLGLLYIGAPRSTVKEGPTGGGLSGRVDDAAPLEFGGGGDAKEAIQRTTEALRALSPRPQSNRILLLESDSGPHNASSVGHMDFLEVERRSLIDSSRLTAHSDVEEILLVLEGTVEVEVDNVDASLAKFDLHYAPVGPVALRQSSAGAVWLTVRYHGQVETVGPSVLAHISKGGSLPSMTVQDVSDQRRRLRDGAHFFAARRTRTLPRLNLATVVVTPSTRPPGLHAHTYASLLVVLEGFFRVDYVDPETGEVRAHDGLSTGAVLFLYPNVSHHAVLIHGDRGIFFAILLQHDVNKF